MNTTIKIALLIGSATFCHTAYAAPPMDNVISAMSQREKTVSKGTFQWQMSYKEVDAGETAQQITMKQRAISQQLPFQLRKLGITDESGIKAQVKAMTDHIAEAGRGATFTSSTKWTFVRNGSETLVSGTRQLNKLNSTDASIQEFRHYYNKNTGLVFNDGVVINGRKAKPVDPVVWSSNGEIIRLLSPATEGLGVEPEHFVLLTSTNPFLMYGNNWKVLSDTSSYWKLSLFTKQNGTLPVSIEMTLNKSQGNLPSDIEVSVNKGQSVTKAHVVEYRMYKSTPVVSRVILSEHESGVDKVQDWRLLGVNPSNPISLAYSQKNPVHDFRLVGSNLSELAESRLTKRDRASVVLYRWPGQLPSIQRLRQLRDLQYPGEGAPDLGQNTIGTLASTASVFNSALPFAGGVLCLVGGVWMFKQRKAN